MVEALAEFWHQKIRKELLIAGLDAPEIKGLFRKEYQGARYSPGYPAWPSIEQQRQICTLLRPERIGVRLSETWQFPSSPSVPLLSTIPKPDILACD